MSRPKLLDLFCGAGGAAMGYHRAGFDVVGIDINPQPRFPFEFHQGDAMEWPLDGFDVIHASPPCQAYTVARNIRKREHPKLIEVVRERLTQNAGPWIIENVHGAPLRYPVRLCGTAFGLSVRVRGIEYELRRHRIFESSLPLWASECNHRLPVIGIYGHGESKAMRGKRKFQISQVEHRRSVMQMEWANRDEIAEAIPPAYTEYLGRQLIALISSAQAGRETDSNGTESSSPVV